MEVLCVVIRTWRPNQKDPAQWAGDGLEAVGDGRCLTDMHLDAQDAWRGVRSTLYTYCLPPVMGGYAGRFDRHHDRRAIYCPRADSSMFPY